MSLSKYIAAGIALIPIITCAQQAITIKSPPDTFKVNTTAQATIRVDGPFLQVQISRHTMWAPKSFKDTTQVISYTAAIATYNNEGRWETQRQSTPTESPFTLAPGETHQLPATTLLIPVDGIKRLDKHWIVLMTKVASPHSRTGYGHTYAHSEKLTLQAQH